MVSDLAHIFYNYDDAADGGDDDKVVYFRVG